MRIAITLLVVLLGLSVAEAQVHVDGHYRSNGTYVQPYQRTKPDGYKGNNYGSPGNYNPNTGRVTPQPSNPYGSLGGGYGGNKRNSLGGWDDDE